MRDHCPLRCVRAAATIAGFMLATTSAVAAAAGAMTAAPMTTAAKVIAELEAFCKPEAVQAVSAGLSPKVTVKDVANGPKLPGGAKYFAASQERPAFCQVSGSFVTHPKTAKTANFLATFPVAWNGKYLQLGCSGHCGQFAVSDPAMPMVTITNQGYPNESILKGYAAFATDEGHEGFAGGLWAIKGPGQVDQDAIDDFYFRADQVLAKLGKEFTVAFYAAATRKSQKIARSYFNGCSGGGRDAFVAAAYFPEEFDGIIGGSAAKTTASLQFAGTALATIRSPDAAIPASLIAQIDLIVKAKCDKIDGVEDGLIQNPAACDFSPERDLPRCAAGAPVGKCFTDAQLQTLSTLVTAVTDEDGNVLQPGYTISELKDTALRVPPNKSPTAPDPFPNSDSNGYSGTYWPLADAEIRVFVHKNAPGFVTRSIIDLKSGGPGSIQDFHIVVPKAEAALLADSMRMANGHQLDRARRLIKLDRKFLMWQNLSDEVLSPYMTINYYKQLAQQQGGYAELQRNVRLFAIPGSGHCSMSGVGPNKFDALTAMEDWVEKGKAPEALVASIYDPTGVSVDLSKQPLRTMPLCKFPEMAHYSGHGDVNDAENWRCPANDTSMLTVGPSGRRAGVVE